MELLTVQDLTPQILLSTGTLTELESKYILWKPVGQGAYGIVFAAQNKRNGEAVAIKKVVDVLSDLKEAKRTLREVKLLRHFRKHENIIHILDLLPNRREFKHLYIVMELMDGDLTEIINSDSEVTISEIKIWMYQLLRGINYMHKANVVHRDLRPRNLLIKNRNLIKIADLGMGRTSTGGKLSLLEFVTSRYYCAPEGFFPSIEYTYAVDIWSAAAIFAELLLRRVFIKGSNDADQLIQIFSIFGKPDQDFIWSMNDKDRSDFSTLPVPSNARSLTEFFPQLDELGLDLLKKMFDLNPTKRITASEALAHPWFEECWDMYNNEHEVEEFTFNEIEEMSVETLKGHFYQEILKYQ